MRKRITKVLAMMLVAMLLVSNLETVAYASQEKDSYAHAIAIEQGVSTQEQVEYEYELLEDGTARLTKYIGTSSDVVVPATVEGYAVSEIGMHTFYNYYDMEHLVISEGITKICEEAFYYCTQLTDMQLPDSLQSIEMMAFYGCRNLDNVRIPLGLTSLPAFLFFECTGLTNLEILDNITHIEPTLLWSMERDVTITCKENSAAHQYAMNQGVNCKTFQREITGTTDYKKTIDEGTFILDAVISDEDAELSYTSSDESVVTVDENGEVTVVGLGKAIITVSAEETIKYEEATFDIDVTVARKDRTLTGTTSYNKMEGDDVFSLDVVASDEDAVLSYTSSNESVVTVDENGEVTVIGVGIADITVIAEQSDVYEAASLIVKVTVERKPIKVTKITLSKTSATLQKGKTLTLKATVTPSNADNKEVVWSSSNTKVATVSSTGKVTAKGGGVATITATAKDGSGVKASCKITVKYKITYLLNGGTNHKSNPSTYYNEKVTLRSPTRKAYVFKGWYTDKKFKNKITSIKKESAKDYTLYAKWEKVTVSKTTITSAKNSKSKTIALKYKKSASAKGYEIVYSTDKNFKKSVIKKTSTKTSYTIKSLKKGKTYYVKVRAYKLDSTGKKIYSGYSKSVKVKITK